MTNTGTIGPAPPDWNEDESRDETSSPDLHRRRGLRVCLPPCSRSGTAASQANIHLFEEPKVPGGALDGRSDRGSGLLHARGPSSSTRWPYQCYFDMLSTIPSRRAGSHDKGRSDVQHGQNRRPRRASRTGIFEFNKTHRLNTVTRLVGEGGRVDHTKLGLEHVDRIAPDRASSRFLSLPSTAEDRRATFALGSFQDPFLVPVRLMFGFEPRHSLIECSSIPAALLPRSAQHHDVRGWNTPYNNYESIVMPIQRWLVKQGVDIQIGVRSPDVDFRPSRPGKTVERPTSLRTRSSSAPEIAFNTIGSKGSIAHRARIEQGPALVTDRRDGGWSFWARMAAKVSGITPTFSGHVDQTKWAVFTITTQGPLSPKESGNCGQGAGTATHPCPVSTPTGGWPVCPVSAALQKSALTRRSCSDTGSTGMRRANHVKKTMTESTGEELLTELVYHPGFLKDLDRTTKSRSPFPRRFPCHQPVQPKEDQSTGPRSFPKARRTWRCWDSSSRSPTTACSWWDYSTRSAQIGVYRLLNVEKPVTPVYTGHSQSGAVGECLAGLPAGCGPFAVDETQSPPRSWPPLPCTRSHGRELT